MFHLMLTYRRRVPYLQGCRRGAARVYMAPQGRRAARPGRLPLGSWSSASSGDHLQGADRLSLAIHAPFGRFRTVPASTALGAASASVVSLLAKARWCCGSDPPPRRPETLPKAENVSVRTVAGALDAGRP